MIKTVALEVDCFSLKLIIWRIEYVSR